MTMKMKMKRSDRSGSSSPRPRGLDVTVEPHQFVTACRAEGAQDIEARIRVLEEQREHDHSHFRHANDTNLRIRDYVQRMEERHSNQLEELDQRNKELVKQSTMFARDLAVTKGNSMPAARTSRS